ncbi:MAG: histone deacetylase 11 [Rhodothermales bacterium]|jgi:histone deacetylase 11
MEISRIVYSPAYNIGFFGLEKLHPFDSPKYARAWSCLKTEFGDRLKDLWIEPDSPISNDELLGVHTQDYLQRLRDSTYLAGAIEI